MNALSCFVLPGNLKYCWIISSKDIALPIKLEGAYSPLTADPQLKVTAKLAQDHSMISIVMVKNIHVPMFSTKEQFRALKRHPIHVGMRAGGHSAPLAYHNHSLRSWQIFYIMLPLASL